MIALDEADPVGLDGLGIVDLEFHKAVWVGRGTLGPEVLVQRWREYFSTAGIVLMSVGETVGRRAARSRDR